MALLYAGLRCKHRRAESAAYITMAVPESCHPCHLFLSTGSQPHHPLVLTIQRPQRRAPAWWGLGHASDSFAAADQEVRCSEAATRPITKLRPEL